MKRIKINQIEKRIGKKLKNKSIAIGFDIAKRLTGIAVLRTHRSTLEIVKLHKINNQKGDLIESMEYFIGELNNFISGLNLGKNNKIFVIEDCWFGQNVTTLKVLARFSALTWRELKHIPDHIYFILPTTSRSKVGFKKDKNDKRKAKVQVLNYVNKLFGLDLKQKDMDLSDGIILALSGLIKLEE